MASRRLQVRAEHRILVVLLMVGACGDEAGNEDAAPDNVCPHFYVQIHCQ